MNQVVPLTSESETAFGGTEIRSIDVSIDQFYRHPAPYIYSYCTRTHNENASSEEANTEVPGVNAFRKV